MATIKEELSFEEKLCKVLKLDSHKMISITIKVKHDDLVLVTTEQILFEEEGSEILKMLKYYHLEPLKDENKTIEKNKPLKG